MTYHPDSVDLAQSWFNLGEILAVIAGLFMVAAGFLIVPASEGVVNYKNALDLCEKVISIPDLNGAGKNNTLTDCLKDYGASYGKAITKSNHRGNMLFASSLVIGANSVICWLRGRFRIKYFKSKRAIKDWQFGFILLVADIIVTVILMIYFPISF